MTIAFHIKVLEWIPRPKESAEKIKGNDSEQGARYKAQEKP
jgi:hypothetical protein